MQPDHNHPSPKFTAFVHRLGALVAAQTDDVQLRVDASALLRDLVAVDDWLAPEHALPDSTRYRQNLLHLDAEKRFSVVAFVWGPGQQTAIHDHTVWGLIGMLRGAETSQGYRFTGPSKMVKAGQPTLLQPGQVEAVGPRIGDIHHVRNAYDDRVSVSIHVYGGDIGAVERNIYSEDGTPQAYISGYSEPLERTAAHTEEAAS